MEKRQMSTMSRWNSLETVISGFPRTRTSDQHIIPFGFPEEDCDVLMKFKDASMVVPLYFLESASECFKNVLERHGGVVQVKSNKPNHIHHSLDLINLKLKYLIQALSFYHDTQTIQLSGKEF